MKSLQMVDLKRQYQHIKSEVDAAITKVIENATFINGPEVKNFSQELADYLGVKHVIPCANGTDALQISLMALDLKPGDEVITPSFTYIATVEVVALLGLTPVFVDVDPDHFNMDPIKLKNAITSKTKAIIPVHLYGQSAPMEEILAIAAENNIPIIEDNAQAIGGEFTFSNGETKKNGTMGTIGCTSFFPSKNLGCYGDGGAICTNDDELFEKISMIANHGQKERYYHEIIGCNSRLDSIQAAILSIKLKRLDEYNQHRREVADYYDTAFDDNPFIIIPERVDYAKHVFHQYTIKLSSHIDRDIVRQKLEAEGIPSMIYYPVPAHRQKMFNHLGGRTFSLPVTDELTPIVLSLPIHTEMTKEELTYISEKVNEIVLKLGNQ